MVFFQTGLLLGYGYAHLGNRVLGVKGQVLVHLLLSVLAFLCLPIAIPRDIAPPESPRLWLIQTLVVTVGLPLFVVASHGPLLQSWFARSGNCPDPYFLYAGSNLGSFAALIAYPVLVEPNLTLESQGKGWMIAYAGMVLALSACGLCVWRKRSGGILPPQSAAAGCRRYERLRWVLLALVPSSLMLSVTTYLTTDIAAIPLLWIIPLGIYLLTFSLVFARKQLVPHQVFVRWMPMVVVILAIMILQEGTEPLFLVLSLHLFGLFWLAMVCHGELARTRPPADRLTEFYIWLAVGGVLGGLFNALVAPVIFNALAEYPLMIALACLLRPSPMVTPFRLRRELGIPLLVGGLTLVLIGLGRAMNLPAGPTSMAALFALPLILVYLLQNRSIPFGLSLAAVFLAGSQYAGIHGPSSYQTRSFFGIHRVTEQDGFRRLFHGHILHGQENLDPQRLGEPLTYYYRTGPIGQLLTALQGDERLKRVGLIGLGTGALASYTQAGQHWTFFEIDPAVASIAASDKGFFSYLRDAKGQVDVVVGDGRLALNQQPDKFGLLVIDAFGSDAIPLHLLTREALRVYLAHLQDHGILAFHISNLYVDLEPVLANLALDSCPKLVCRIQYDLDLNDADMRRGKKPSVWVIMARSARDFGPLENSPGWRPARSNPDLQVWTDDFSNLVSVVRW